MKCLKTYLGLAACGVVLFTVPRPAFSQVPDTFNPNPNNYVLPIALQPDGRILVGGMFSRLGGEARSGMGRLNPDGTLDTSFNPGALGLNAIAVQSNGKVLLAGVFLTLGGQARSYIGRVNADGTLDGGFDPGANNWVNSLAVQVDEKILVGGSFSTLAGQTRVSLGRLNADGTLDSAFAPAVNNAVYPIVLQNDGKILLGGLFTTLNGQSRYYIGRLNSDGTLDTDFNPGASSQVFALALQGDGKILVGGTFSSLAGQMRRYLGRLNADGTVDVSFNPSANGVVNSIAVQTDGKILVAGAFNVLGPQARNYLARLNPDGSLDSSFNPGAGAAVNSLAIQADGKILVGGTFMTLGGQSRKGIGRLNNTGTATDELAFDGTNVTWLRAGSSPEIARASFDVSTNGYDWRSLGAGSRINGGWQWTNVSPPTNGWLRARGSVGGGYYNGSSWLVETIGGPALLTSQPASRTNKAGTVATFAVTAGGTPPLNYQWFKDGVPLDDGANVAGTHTPILTVTNLLHVDTGEYFAVVTNASGNTTSVVARLTVLDPAISVQPAHQSTNSGGTAAFAVLAGGTPPFGYQWRKAGIPLEGKILGSLLLTNVQTDDAGSYDVVISNSFGSVTSTVAWLTVNTVTADTANPGADFSVYALAVQMDGKILVGGSFSRLGGQTRNYLGRLNADGTLDLNFNPSANGIVYGLAVQADGKILVVGHFTSLAGLGRMFIARLNPDGSLDNSYNPGASSDIYSLAVQPDGKVVVAGAFYTLAGQTHNYIGRLNADGSLDSGFNGSAGSFIYSTAIQADGKILAGGNFLTLNGTQRLYLGRFNADGSLDTAFNPGAGMPTLCLAVQADQKILVGGQFPTLGSEVRNKLGRLNSDGTVDLSFNPGASDDVLCLAVQTDGKILVGGSFTNLGGVARSGIGRLNPDGTPDTNFNPGAPGVNAIALQADGRIVVGGSFTTLAGQPRAKLGRLNNTVAAAQELSVTPSSVTWLRSGTSPEVVSAKFESFNGTAWVSLGTATRMTGGWQLTNVAVPTDAPVRARGRVAAGQYNGSSYPVGTTTGRAAITSQPPGRTNNAGSISTFSVLADGSEPLSYRWLKNGVPLADEAHVAGAQTAILNLSSVLAADAANYSVVVSNALGVVTSAVAVLVVIDPVIDVTGQPVSCSIDAGQPGFFRVTAGGTPPLAYQWRKDGTNLSGAVATDLHLTNAQRGHIGWYDVVVSNIFGAVTSTPAMLTVNLSTNDSFNPQADDFVRALAVQPDGKILVGGNFYMLGESVVRFCARLHRDGEPDTNFNAGADEAVLAFATQTDGKILVGGAFTTLHGQPRNHIGRLNADGTLDINFNPNADGLVYAITLDASGRIILGGAFHNVSGQSRHHIARLSTEGTLDQGFHPGSYETYVSSILVQPNGQILVGGLFEWMGGQLRNYLARVNSDGSLDASFNPNPDWKVAAVALQPDGKIIIGGSFWTVAGQPALRLARLNADGSFDHGYSGGASNDVYSLALQADGKLLVAGAFNFLAGRPRNYLGRFNADGSLDATFNPGANAAVYALAPESDGQVLAAGNFTQLADQSRGYLGRLSATDPASAMLTTDGASVTWLRSGPVPEVGRASFEFSTNGTAWIALGVGARIVGGWQLTGVSVPGNALLRASGFVTGGYHCGSSWFVETSTEPASLAILVSDGQFGFHAKQFGFTLSGGVGQTAVVESSTNLFDWVPVTTNTMESGRLQFRDAASSNALYRFYRARAQ